LTLVRAYSGGATFTATNSARHDFGVLNNKGVKQACVLTMARPSENGDNLGHGRGSQGKRQQRHTIALILFQARRQGNDGATWVALTALTDGLVAYLDTYQRLNGATGVKRAQIVEIAEPRIRRDEAWVYQTIFLDVMTETAPVLVETAS
jgi:hypothetical protein